MKTVQQLLESKRHGVASVAPETSVLDALKVMAEKEIGAVLVLDGDALAGIFSERDYARKVVLQGALVLFLATAASAMRMAWAMVAALGWVTWVPSELVAKPMISPRICAPRARARSCSPRSTLRPRSRG